MNDESTNHHHDQTPENPDPNALELGALLRCAADGELTDAQQAELDAHLAKTPEDHARIEFERALHTCCTRALGADQGEGKGLTAPASLRERIAAGATEAESEPVIATVTPDGVTTRSGAGSIERMIRPLMGLAAAIALVAAATLFLRGALLANGQFGIAQASALTEYVEKEHSRCMLPDAANAKFIEDAGELPGPWADLVGNALSIEAMTDAGYRFVGAGECHLPGKGGSVHLMFEEASHLDADGRPLAMSLFLKRLPEDSELVEGRTYLLDERCDRGGPIVMWVRDGLLYSLVSDCPNACATARTALAAPPGEDRSLLVDEQ